MKKETTLALAILAFSSLTLGQSCDSSCGPAYQVSPQPYNKPGISTHVMPRIQGYTIYEYQCDGGQRLGRRMVYNTSNEFLYSSAWLPTNTAC